MDRRIVSVMLLLALAGCAQSTASPSPSASAPASTLAAPAPVSTFSEGGAIVTCAGTAGAGSIELLANGSPPTTIDGGQVRLMSAKKIDDTVVASLARAAGDRDSIDIRPGATFQVGSVTYLAGRVCTYQRSDYPPGSTRASLTLTKA